MKNLLSITGGGFRGIVALDLLKEVYHKEAFNMIVGNSRKGFDL